jgi:polyphosphate kinase 2 (PPK2 family)
MIGVFDRSHYEDVLIGKVRRLAPPEDIEQRYADIVAFEDELVANGTTVVKVMLHISSDEQKERLADRLDRPDKHWKYNPGDLEERLVWNDYQDAYETAIRRTSTETAPWFVVPADRKWYARIAVQKLLTDALASRGLEWPAAQYDVELEKTKLATS